MPKIKKLVLKKTVKKPDVLTPKERKSRKYA